jgi:integrase/recombinase XerD
MPTKELEQQIEVPLCTWYLAKVKPASRRTIYLALRQIADLAGHPSPFAVPWQELTPEVVHRLIEKAEERWQAGTVKRIGLTISQVCKEGMRRGVWTPEAFESLKEACRSYKPAGWSPAAGRSLRTDELRGLLQAPIPERDRLILVLGIVLGLRRSEIVGLSCGDLNPIASTLRVKGKNSKVRYVPIPDEIVSELSDWRGSRPGHFPLFASAYGGRLADRTIWQIVDRARRMAGVDHCTVHDLRRTAITHMLEAGHDPLLVARAVGHSNPSTTMVYDRRGEDKTRGVFGQLRRKIEREDPENPST